VDKKNLLLKLDGIVRTAKETQQRYLQIILTFDRNNLSCSKLSYLLDALQQGIFTACCGQTIVDSI
jgi:hypothetical protein